MEKIALVIKSLSSGGGERVVATLSQGFAKHYDVTVIVYSSQNIDYEYGGKLIDIDCKERTSLLGKCYNLLKRSYQLKKIYQREQFDHIFGFMESANYPSILASTKTIASLHIDYGFLCKKDQFLVRNLYPMAQAVAPVSEDIAGTLRNKLTLNNVSCIYNPVAFEALEQHAAKPFDHPRKFIIAVGRLTFQKHFDLMIDAYAQSKAQAQYDLIILGEGELRESLESQIRRLGMKDKIHMPGRLKNPFTYMKHAEFMALSSRAEGFPMVLIEALSLGCPVVSADCPTGPREIVQNEVNGLLIAPEDQALLTDAMDRLFEDKALRQRLSKNAPDSVKHLSVDNICQAWIRLSKQR